jgi:ABC-2 type transport system ATP-binding protein
MGLELRSVSKSYGSYQAVRDLSFTVRSGEVFGLLGLNGAGKSTTIRMIIDILNPDAGTILWDGKPTRLVLNRMGYLPEERGLYQQMKVLQQLIFFGQLQGMNKSAAQDAATKWLSRFGIAEAATRTVSDLSKGNQQKVQFIAAVLHNPALIILDEPFSGLDPVNTSLFKTVFKELVHDGKTILFSSHRLDHVEELSDAVGIIHESRLMQSGRVEEILATEAPKILRIGSPDLNRVKGHLPEACTVAERRGMIEVSIDEVNPDGLLRDLLAHDVPVTHFEFVRPTLNDVFLQRVGKSA